MATYYSAFFNSGLRNANHEPPVPRPSTPDNTDPAAIPESPIQPPPNHHDRPRLRHRKSSLSITAAAATLLAPVTIRSNSGSGSGGGRRSRSGSMTDSFIGRLGGSSEATQGNSLMGRLRSGSLSAIRARGRANRNKTPAPPLPPPALPLPLPPQPTTSTQPQRTPPPSIVLPIPKPGTPHTPHLRSGNGMPRTPSTTTTTHSTASSLPIPLYTPPASRALTPSVVVGGGSMANLTLEDSPMVLPPGSVRKLREMSEMEVEDYPSPADETGHGKGFF